jgi:Calx-beta domain
LDYATADGSATAPDDYTSTSGTLSFAPGETTKQVDVPVVGETAAELEETFALNLSAASHAAIDDDPGVGTITDNDPDPSISIDNLSVPEGDAGTTQATFTVSLSASSFKTITVDYATADGTAAAPGDYASTSGTLSFAPGETSKQAPVTANGDAVHEGNETFTVSSPTPPHASIAGAGGTGTIADNDKVVTSLAAKASKKQGSVSATGTMLNAQIGFKVSVKLQRLNGHKYAKGLTRTATIKSVTDTNSDGVMEGRFSTKFKLPPKGSYRFLVTFAGDAGDLPATATAKFKV